MPFGICSIRYTKRNVKRQLLKQRRADLPFVMLVAQANGYMCWFTLVSEYNNLRHRPQDLLAILLLGKFDLLTCNFFSATASGLNVSVQASSKKQ